MWFGQYQLTMRTDVSHRSALEGGGALHDRSRLLFSVPTEDDVGRARGGAWCPCIRDDVGGRVRVRARAPENNTFSSPSPGHRFLAARSAPIPPPPSVRATCPVTSRRRLRRCRPSALPSACTSARSLRPSGAERFQDTASHQPNVPRTPRRYTAGARRRRSLLGRPVLDMSDGGPLPLPHPHHRRRTLVPTFVDLPVACLHGGKTRGQVEV